MKNNEILRTFILAGIVNKSKKKKEGHRTMTGIFRIKIENLRIFHLVDPFTTNK